MHHGKTATPVEHIPDPKNPRAYRDALSRFATGVTVVTARETGGGGPVGITVNSFASVSLDPALVLWSAARSSLRHAHFSGAPAFAIHVLAADQAELAARFAKRGTGFDGLSYVLNDQGVPLLSGTLARFECLTEARHQGGDHTIIIGRVTRFTTDAEDEALVFAHGQYGRFTPLA
ncbi:flavin reductase family protein [Phaeovulum sp.]|uniref:flavin reductase family protein n=1 Tax=Phaeovulum sp. TaxID=2934796 RepID=UPI0039E71C0F